MTSRKLSDLGGNGGHHRLQMVTMVLQGLLGTCALTSDTQWIGPTVQLAGQELDPFLVLIRTTNWRWSSRSNKITEHADRKDPRGSRYTLNLFYGTKLIVSHG